MLVLSLTGLSLIFRAAQTPRSLSLLVTDARHALASRQWPFVRPGEPRDSVGRKVAFRHAATSRYCRVATGGDREGAGTLLADRSVHWAHGGTFEMFLTVGGAWEILSRSGDAGFVTVGANGVISTRWSTARPFDWSSFTDTDPGAWAMAFTIVPASGVHPPRTALLQSSASGHYIRRRDDGVLVADGGGADLFVIEPIESIIGVNLGSWFVPEPGWTVLMEHSLCEEVARDAALAESKLRGHLDPDRGWIRECHFDWMVDHGINTVRVPLGWWNVLTYEELGEVGDSLAWQPLPPTDPNVSLATIDRVFEWAESRGMRVLLDLHGGPGSQNGKDHSGCHILRDADWHKHSYRASLDVIRRLMARYGRSHALWGVELLNEPGDMDGPTEKAMRHHLRAYYEDAYQIVRGVSDSVKVVFNVLYWWDYWAWASQLREPEYHNVILDMHLYTAFEGFTASTSDATILRAAHNFHCRCMAHAYHHPIIIGEWSLAIDLEAKKVTQAYADAQLTAFKASLGWFFWNLKMDPHAPLAMRSETGAPIGSSPQWDLIKAVDAARSLDSTSNATINSDTPHLGHHMPLRSGAGNIDDYCGEASGALVPPASAQPPLPPPSPPTPLLAPPNTCASYVAAYGCGWLHPSLCAGALTNGSAWKVFLESTTNVHPEGSPFMCCCPSIVLSSASPPGRQPSASMPLFHTTVTADVTVNSVRCPDLSFGGIILLLIAGLTAVCTCCTWLPCLKYRCRYAGKVLCGRFVGTIVQTAQTWSVVDRSHDGHQLWRQGKLSWFAASKYRGERTVQGTDKAVLDMTDAEKILLGELEWTRIRLMDLERHAASMEMQLAVHNPAKYSSTI